MPWQALAQPKPLLIPPSSLPSFQALYAETDAASGGWLSHAASLLAACSSQLAPPSSGGSGSKLQVTHVAVTSGQLIPSLAKLLLYRLVPHIAPQHVWSSRFVGKRRCFERVRRRFGAGCAYLAVGGRGASAGGEGMPHQQALAGQAFAQQDKGEMLFNAACIRC